MSLGAEQSGIAALLDKADAYAREGNPRAAVSFYQAALQNARSSPALDGGNLGRLRAAQEFIQRRAADFERSLNEVLERSSAPAGEQKTRLSHAFDMLKGRRAIYPQQPSVLYYPYLAQRQFFERGEFDWVPRIEAAAPAIREELLALLQGGPEFRPYVEDEADRPQRQFHELNNSPDWSALYLWRDSELVSEVAERCPRTVAALSQVPLTHIGRRTPSVLFSRLLPGAHIPPHSGMLNCRLICHLPLIVPEGCWLRVGNETRKWKEGEVLIFDDSIEHEAMNPTGELRIILLFDVWRPELGDEERKAISRIFRAIDDFQGIPND